MKSFSAPKGVDPERYALAIAFMGECYDMFDAYLNSISGLRLVGQNIEEFQKTALQHLQETDPEKASIDFLDAQPVEHRLEAASHDPERAVFSTTQGELKANTRPFGPFERLLGRMVVTFLYAAWEDRYREKFAKLLGLKTKSELKDDLFGDLGYLRNAAVHNHGIATSAVANKTRLLRWYKQGQEIVISVEHADTILDEMDHFCARFCGIPRNVPSLRDVPSNERV